MEKAIKWKYCIKEKCDEGYCGRCHRPNWDLRDGNYPEKECIDPFMFDLSWVDDWKTTDIIEAFDPDELLKVLGASTECIC